MESLVARWSGLSAQRRMLLAGGLLACLLSFVGIARLAATPDMALLYGGLDGAGAGGVLAELDQRGVAYDIRGDSVYVPKDQRDGLRMSLASEGLPSNSMSGYELLDSLSGFGTTSQMFDAAYWRAKEGELARTILTNPRVDRARVHISTTPTGAFATRGDLSASITVSLRDGGIPEGVAESFRFLVASAVGGLSPEDVAVIDASTGRVIGRGAADDMSAVGRERADLLKANVHRLLSARVGAGNAVVEVNVEPVAQSEVIRERVVDPDSRVAISTNVEEVSTNEQNGSAAGVTVASNLPDGDAADGGNQSQRQNAETRAITNYEVSETTREVEIAPGGVKRLSVAVLVNDAILASEDDDRETELAQIERLVAAAVGFDEARGDSLTVEALPFSPPSEIGDAPTAAPGTFLGVSLARLLPLGVLAAVALALGLFVVRPVLRGAEMPALNDGTLDLMEPTALGPAAVIEMASDERGVPSDPSADGPPGLPDDGARPPGFAALPAPPSEGVGHLKDVIEARQDDTLAVLKSWLEDDRKETA